MQVETERKGLHANAIVIGNVSPLLDAPLKSQHYTGSSVSFVCVYKLLPQGSSCAYWETLMDNCSRGKMLYEARAARLPGGRSNRLGAGWSFTQKLRGRAADMLTLAQPHASGIP